MKLRPRITGGFCLLAVVAVMYLGWPYLRAMRDRAAVRNYRLDPATAIEVTLQDDGGDPMLSLSHDKAIRLGEDTVIYSRSMSHHNGSPSFRGYTFVNINGSVWRNRTGPCTSSPLLILRGHQVEDIDEDVIKATLRRMGYAEISRKAAPSP